MIIKVGNRYGKAEVTSINPGKINFMCGCGTPFSSSSDVVRRQGAPRACKQCINIQNTVVIGRRGTMNGMLRDYTSKEEQMIKDFENDRS